MVQLKVNNIPLVKFQAINWEHWNAANIGISLGNSELLEAIVKEPSLLILQLLLATSTANHILGSLTCNELGHIFYL